MTNIIKIIALSILLLTVSFSSCKKCADCTITTTTSVNQPTPGYPQTITTTFEVCGDDLDAVDGQTITATSTVGTITATSIARTSCILK